MRRTRTAAIVGISLLILMLLAGAAMATPSKQETPQPAGIFRGVSTAERFDVSPPLRSIKPLTAPPGTYKEIPDRPTGLEGALGPQDADGALQTSYGPNVIPTPIVSFNGPGNISSVSPPDPVGDVGPNHYVAMSNLSFQVFDKTGTSLFGPALNNTLWAGFGGPCQTENSGDPIVIYDQLDDRWILTQFTSAGPTYYNCVAVSQTPDPTGAYYRYAFSTGSNFPDYPKYGMWTDALYISTREFAGGSTFVGVGAYAINRAQLIAGNPAATVISFLATPASAGGAYNVGDGLLPTDLDGFALPSAGTPNFFVGSMDNGGPYGAPQDALTLWKFTVDFATPANSSFVLANTIPIAAIDTIPAFCSGRACVPQPGTATKLDHLGYRQRPLWRLAYRNFGSHESLVTNQAVEASATMSGIRWWEIRSPNSSPVIYQEGTYAPGLVDGIHRWMGSIAMDSAGNMALGYSASDGTSTFPSSWYTGRLAADPLHTMPQGESAFINGTGSQTGSQRWGDYTSMNVDPVDDCTFWYVNEWVPTTSSVGWQLRIGSFRFAACGTPDFTLGATPTSAAICAPTAATYTVTLGSVSGYTDNVTLAANPLPTNATANFSVNPVTPPGNSLLTIGNTGAVAAGSYNIDVVGVATTSTHTTTVGLSVFTLAPGAPTLLLPANNAINVAIQPTFSWNVPSQAMSYTIEIATDAGFTNIVHTGTAAGTTYNGATLNSNTTYYWRVRADNLCGAGVNSAVFKFRTQAAAGDCAVGSTANILYSTDFEAGAPGWTHSGTGDTWALSSANPRSGVQAWRAADPASVSDQRLVSPQVVVPSGQNPVTLKFWHVPNMEPSGTTACFDGGILEVTANGGITWTQVPNANLLAGAYRGLVSSSFGNPLGGLQAWCGTTTYTNTIADVSSYAGQTVQFRFRLGSDASVAATGWDVDDVVVQSCRANVPPAWTSVNVEPNPVEEAAVVTLTGVFTDADAGDSHIVGIDWGDGSLPVTVPTLGPGVYTFTATHQYADGAAGGTLNNIALTLDDGVNTVDTTTSVTVTNVAPTLSNLAATTVNENGVTTLTGIISDPGVNDSLTLDVNWGDGITGTFSYPAGTTLFTETHQYLDDNPSGTPSDVYIIGLTVTDSDGGSSSASSSVTVNNLAPTLSNVAVTSPINENGSATLTGNIADVGTQDSFTLTVNWGDGHTSDFTYPAGTTAFTETHQYLDDDPSGTPSDTYAIGLTLTDDDTGSTTASTSITVNNVAPTVLAGSNVTAVPNAIIHFTGSISDPGTLDTFFITWNFGDSNTITGTLTPAHAYASAGTYTVTLTVMDDDTGAGTSSLVVTIVPRKLYLPLIMKY